MHLSLLAHSRNMATLARRSRLLAAWAPTLQAAPTVTVRHSRIATPTTLAPSPISGDRRPWMLPRWWIPWRAALGARSCYAVRASNGPLSPGGAPRLQGAAPHAPWLLGKHTGERQLVHNSAACLTASTDEAGYMPSSPFLGTRPTESSGEQQVRVWVALCSIG